MTLAPEHELVKIITTSEQSIIEDYINSVSSKSEKERQTDLKNISGVFTGAYAIPPIH